MKLSYISSILAVSTTQPINNTMKTYRTTQRTTAAFSLIELTIALGVAGFCLIAVLGMLPAGLNTNQNSTRQTAANGILSAILADIRATPKSATNSPLFGIAMSSSTAQTLCCDANGSCSILSGSQCAANTLFLVTITGGSGSSSPSWGRGGGDDGEEDNKLGTKSVGTERFDVKITWPYSAASPAPAAAGNLEAFIGIDRNAKSHGGGEGEDGD